MKDLIPLIDSTSHPDLEDIRKEKYDKALVAIITGKVPPEDFAGKRIPVRPIRGGAEVEYIPGWWMDEQGNALFSHLWSYEVREISQIVVNQKQLWVKGRLTIHVPKRTVTIETKSSNGEVVTKTTVYEGMDIVKEQFGGSDIKRLKDSNEIMDIGDDLKSAATDAKKKCWTEFGFASTIYGKREIMENTAPKTSQLEAMYALGQKVKKSDGSFMTIDDVKAFCKTKYDKEPAELEEVFILGLIKDLRHMVGKT